MPSAIPSTISFSLPSAMKLSITVIFFLFPYFQVSYATQKYTSMFSFGDSLNDAGNFLKTGAAAFPTVGRLPYGMTFFGHPTGRFSDGRLIVDFIAQALNLPLLPPYLERREGQDFRQGVNFAVAGATALDPSFFIKRGLGGVLATNYSLSTQIGWFDKLKPSLCHSTQECWHYLSKSLFLVGQFGPNDYNYLQMSGVGSLYDLYSSVPKVIKAISTTTQKLINQGAVNLLIPGILPSGCGPLTLTTFMSPNRMVYDSQTGCLKKFNDFSKYHNALLIKALQKLRHKNPKAKIIYANHYDAVYMMISYPNKFGLIHEPLKTCCGAGGGPYNFNITVFCGLPGYTVCKDPSMYLNWDGIHLTEAAYHHIADGLLYGPYAQPPIIHS